MSFFMPTNRPPYTPPCENSAPCRPPAIICSGGVICAEICIDVQFNEQDLDNVYDGGVYDYQLLFLTGTQPIVVTVTAGALPAGLAVSAGGHITGTVTEDAEETGSVTFTATNCESGTSDFVWAWEVLECTVPGPVLPLPEDVTNPVLGTEYTIQFTATGTTPIVFTIDLAPPGASFTEDGLLTWVAGSVDEDEHTFTVTATGPCGEPTLQEYTIQGGEAITLRYGNLVFDGAPAVAPTFVATDFTGGGPLNADYTEVDAVAAVTRNGSYIFPAGEGVRQVMWIADSLLAGSETFLVSGLPWGLDPGENTFLQSLTILGVAGKVFFTSDQNNGGYTMTVS